MLIDGQRMVWQFIEPAIIESCGELTAGARREAARLDGLVEPLGGRWIWYTVGITLLLFGGDLRFIAFAASASAELGPPLCCSEQ